MQNFNVDISAPGGPLVFYAMQADSLSRFFTLTITDGGEAWEPPDGALWSVRFGAPQMPSGWYDTIEDATDATHPAVNVATGVATVTTVEIAEQALSTPGQNILCVLVTDSSGYQIASWPIILSIQAVPGLTAPEVTTYYNLLTEQVAQVLQNAQAASASATLAESWAVGGTGTREGEDANNSEYWAQQSQDAANNRVASFNGRTGAVMPQSGDYTANMVGALSTNGGVVNGVAQLKGGTYVFSSDAGKGSLGFVKIVTLNTLSNNLDVPIKFNIFRRGGTVGSDIYIAFSNVASNPTIKSFYFSGDGDLTTFAVVNSSKNIWDIYVKKSEAYDSISVVLYQTDFLYMGGRISANFAGEFYNSVPEEAVYATYFSLASALVSPVKIGSASFDGSQSITLAQMGAAATSSLSNITISDENFTGSGWYLQIGQVVFLTLRFSANSTLSANTYFVNSQGWPTPYAPNGEDYSFPAITTRDDICWINNNGQLFLALSTQLETTTNYSITCWYLVQ